MRANAVPTPGGVLCRLRAIPIEGQRSSTARGRAMPTEDPVQLSHPFQSVGLSVGWSAGRSVDQLAGGPMGHGRSVSLLVGWLVGRSICPWTSRTRMEER